MPRRASSRSPTWCPERRRARRGPAEVSIFDSVGFALNDFSSLRYLHRLDRELAGGSVIDLIPSLDDPKDLFGELKLGECQRDS